MSQRVKQPLHFFASCQVLHRLAVVISLSLSLFDMSCSDFKFHRKFIYSKGVTSWCHYQMHVTLDKNVC